MSKRRGKRIVVGYVVSLSGKRGGPWEARDGVPGSATPHLRDALRGSLEFMAYMASQCCQTVAPHARALPLVRYDVDAEEERLRDAVVEAAVAYDVEAFPGRAGGKYADLIVAVRALRAHREKVGGRGLARKGDRDG